MSKNYAVIVEETGLVENVMVWDGETYIQLPEGRIAVEMEYGAIGWFYHDGIFSPPEEEPPTPEQILASQSAKLVSLKSVANAQKVALNNRINELNDAIEYDVATPEEVAELPVRVAQRKAWGLYSIELGRVTSQDGWPPNVQWPVQPAEGMDLTTSSVTAKTSV